MDMLEKLKKLALSLQGSVLRAGVFAVAWAIFPFWLFFIVGLYLFFVPVSQAKTVLAPFFVLMVLTLFSPVSFYMAVILGLLFWYILLIKELYLIERRTAYEVLMFALVFLLFRLFYDEFSSGIDGALPFVSAFLAGGACGALFAGFLENFAAPPAPRLVRQITAFTLSFLVFELLLAGLFMPLDFVYQTTVVFILTVFAMILAGRFLLSGVLARTEIFVVSSVTFVILVLVLGSARWGL